MRPLNILIGVHDQTYIFIDQLMGHVEMWRFTYITRGFQKHL